MGGTTVLVLGFSFAGFYSWTSARTLGLIISGIGALVLAGIYESFRTENALLPSGIFKQFAVVNVLIISILHNFSFTAATYFIPLFYQAVHGSSPLIAGMRMLPFSLGSALVSFPTARLISHRPGTIWVERTLKIAIALGLALSAIGYGTSFSKPQPDLTPTSTCHVPFCHFGVSYTVSDELVRPYDHS